MHGISKIKTAVLLTANKCIKFTSKTDSLGHKSSSRTKKMNQQPRNRNQTTTSTFTDYKNYFISTKKKKHPNIS